MKHSLLSFLCLGTPLYSAVVLELGPSAFVNPQGIFGGDATLEVNGTMVDPADPSTALTTVDFTITPEPGVSFGDTVFLDNGVITSFDNDQSLWNAGAYQNADGSSVGTNLDRLGLRTTGAREDKGTVDVVFGDALNDLVLHFWQMDVGDVVLEQVNGSTAFTATELSGTIITNPATGLGPGTVLRSGNGSIQLTPDDGSPISSIQFRTVKDGSGTDGWSMFISGSEVVPVPEPSSALLLSLGALCATARRRRN